jgi:hypothetical protein
MTEPKKLSLHIEPIWRLAKAPVLVAGPPEPTTSDGASCTCAEPAPSPTPTPPPTEEERAGRFAQA